MPGRCRNDQASSVIVLVEPRATPGTVMETHMQYMLMVYVNEAGWSKLTPAEQAQGVAAYTAYTEALRQAGVFKGTHRLQASSAATTVRVANGKSQVLNGPYADSQEQLGGFYLIDVPDLDAAISWAARCPGAQHGVIEVRPVWVGSM